VVIVEDGSDTAAAFAQAQDAAGRFAAVRYRALPKMGRCAAGNAALGLALSADEIDYLVDSLLYADHLETLVDALQAVPEASGAYGLAFEVRTEIQSHDPLDYDDLIMASAGHQAEAILEEITHKYKGNYILAVEGNPPLEQEGMSCIIAGRPFVEQLQEVAKDCKAIISWGSCASWGCVQAARPNPTRATPVHEVIRDKPIIKVPGCPPTAEALLYGVLQLQNKIRRTNTIAR